MYFEWPFPRLRRSSGHSIHGLIIYVNSYYEMQFYSTKAPSASLDGLLLK